MTQPAVQPCVYPGCDAGEGQPALTTQVMCGRSRRRYRREVDWIVMDYVTLKMTMPAPVKRGGSIRSSNLRSYGHPAEWASDKAAEIAQALNWIEDGLRDHLGYAPPPNPGVDHNRLVAHAYKLLTDKFDDLCTYPIAGDSATEIHDLHTDVRRLLGQTRFVQRLPTPCPACDTAALVRTVDQIACEECGEVIKPEHYDFMATVILDELITAYDTREAAKLA
jgi:ribosomal protein L37AE/L43A